MGDAERKLKLDHAPRWALGLIALNFLAWFVGLPILIGATSGGDMGAWLRLAAMGTCLTPALVFGLFLRRVMMWFELLGYWYVQAFAAVCGIAGAGIAAALTVGRMGTGAAATPPIAVGTEIAGGLLVAGLIGMAGLAGYVFGRRGKSGQPGAAAPEEAEKPSSAAKAITYVTARARGYEAGK